MRPPSSLRKRIPQILELCAIGGVLVLAIVVMLSMSKLSHAADGHAATIASVTSKRDQSLANLATEYGKLAENQGAVLDRAVRARATIAKTGCEAGPPKYDFGVGILQVTSVPANRGDDTEKFATNQMMRLHTLLAHKSVSGWSIHLTHYLGRADKPIWRVAFKDVDPAVGAEMCTWLRCQNWTGGCAFIDEKGETHVEKNPAEFIPSEDLYQQWKVSSTEPRSPTAPKL